MLPARCLTRAPGGTFEAEARLRSGRLSERGCGTRQAGRRRQGVLWPIGLRSGCCLRPVWLRWLSVTLGTEKLLVGFRVRAPAQAVGWIPGGHVPEAAGRCCSVPLCAPSNNQ